MERRFAVHARADAQALIGRRARRAWIAALAAVSLAGAAGTAEARPKRRDARAAFDRGVAAYQKGNYQAASEALGKSFGLERDVDTLFAWAQAERKLEHCDKAIDLYEQLLSFNLPAANRTAVEQKLAECRSIVAAPPAAPSEPPPAATPPTAPLPSEPPPAATPPGAPPPAAAVAVRVEPEPPRPRSWYRDPVALGLLGSGVVAGGVAAGFFVAAQSASSDSKAAAEGPNKNYALTADLKHTAQQRGDIAIGASIASGVLLVGGVGWILWKHGGSGEQRTVTGWLAPGGGGLAIAGPF